MNSSNEWAWTGPRLILYVKSYLTDYIDGES